jgi:hypothetical protein
VPRARWENARIYESASRRKNLNNFVGFFARSAAAISISTKSKEWIAVRQNPAQSVRFFVKTIIFRFCGGARDGQTVRSDGPHNERNEAVAIWKLTWKGTIGRRFDVTAPDSTAFQRYQIKSKSELGDEVHLNCEHVD